MVKKQLPNWEIRHELRPGDLGYLIYLHGNLYAKEYKYDQSFELYVAHGLFEFVKAFNPYRDRIWLAESEGRIVGAIAIVRSTKLEAQLRWYLVHPDFRGRGLGKSLIQEALNFCADRKYNSVFLWTTSELTKAANIYTKSGFKKTEVKSHTVWGKFIAEEKYELKIVLHNSL